MKTTVAIDMRQSRQMTPRCQRPFVVCRKGVVGVEADIGCVESSCGYRIDAEVL